jgi:hypothetical protein
MLHKSEEAASKATQSQTETWQRRRKDFIHTHTHTSHNLGSFSNGLLTTGEHGRDTCVWQAIHANKPAPALLLLNFSTACLLVTGRTYQRNCTFHVASCSDLPTCYPSPVVWEARVGGTGSIAGSPLHDSLLPDIGSELKLGSHEARTHISGASPPRVGATF